MNLYTAIHLPYLASLIRLQYQFLLHFDSVHENFLILAAVMEPTTAEERRSHKDIL